MSNPKKVTQYMREQIAALDSEGLIEFIRKTKFTVEQRKLLLRELGDVEADPRSTPAEVKSAEKAIELLEEKKPLVEHSASFKEPTKDEKDKKKNRSFFEIPNFF